MYTYTRNQQALFLMEGVAPSKGNTRKLNQLSKTSYTSEVIINFERLAFLLFGFFLRLT